MPVVIRLPKYAAVQDLRRSLTMYRRERPNYGSRRSSTLASRAKKRAATTRPSDQPLAALWFVAVLAFASGCAALIFQVAWMRELRLVFGATTASVAAVLAIFMAGLGLGSAILGKRADRSPNPLRMYGALEWAIALSVAISPRLIDFARATYVSVGGQESLGLTGATIVRLSLAAAVMALPTFLMGGTLPAAVRSVTAWNDDNRRALAVIYGANTLGAVVGAAVATFYALENLGTRATLWAGCFIGLCAANAAIYCARRLEPLSKKESPTDESSPLDSSPKPSADEDEVTTGHRPGLIYLTAGILGFTFFALELVWYRMLGPILGGTTFTFGLILCVALFGIGVGGLAYNFVFRRLQPSWSALAITCGIESLFTIIPYMLGDRLALMAGWRGQSASSFAVLVVGWMFITSIAILPVALVSGLQFPLLIALLGHGRQAISRQLGMAYAWNTLGAIAGSLVAGFGGMPLLSAPGMWLGISILLAALSGLILLATRHSAERSVTIVVAGLVLFTVCAIFASGPTSVWRHSGIGARRAALPPRSRPNDVQKWFSEIRHLVVWDTDGIESSVAIHCTDGLGFIVNGKNDGNAFSDAPTQIGMPILGVMLHNDPKTALVIGLGTGESAGWLAQLRNIEHVDVVELEPAIDEMASRCSDINWNVLQNPRVRRIYDDGREFVFTTKNKYDLIISEPSNPYRAGIATLYTAEFYRAAKKCLNPGGIFIQWLQAYETTDATIGTVLSTIGSQFPHVEVWQTLPLDLQLVCANSPLEYTLPQLKERIDAKNVREALVKAWLVDDVEGFLTHFVAGPAWAKTLAESRAYPLNTDDRTVIEYGFAKSLGNEGQFSIEAARQYLRNRGYQRPAFSDDAIDWNRMEVRRQCLNALHGGGASPRLLPEKADEDLVHSMFDCVAGNFAAAAERWPDKYRQPTDKIVRLMLARCYADLARPEFHQLIPKVAENYPTEAAALQTIYHARKSEWPAAAKSLDSLFTRLDKDPWVVPHVIDEALSQSAVIAQGEPAAAKQIYEHLSKPFASLRRNYQRQVFRVFVGEQLGPDRVVEALQEMEPNVIWIPEALELRAKTYTAVNHPLASQARKDWEWYQRHQPADDKR